MTWDHALASRRFDAAERADIAYRTDQTSLVRYWTKYLEEVGEENCYTSLQFSYPKNKAGGLMMSVPRADFIHYEHFFQNPDGEDATIPITVNTKAFRWDGYVTKAAVVQDENGVQTVEIEAIHCWNHIATTAMWASPFAPIVAQFPRHDTKFGGVETLFLLYMVTNLIRLQAGFWNIQAGWLDSPDWVQTGGLWPITVVPIDVLRDSSPFRAASARFDMGDELLVPLTEGTGVMYCAKFFLPGEDEQPAPDWYHLDVPTVVLWTENHSGVTGPTGTLIDGIIIEAEEWINDTTPVRYPNYSAQSEYESVYNETGELGSVRTHPWPCYLEGEYSGIGSAEIALHKPIATRVIVGGRSPGWMNAGIEIVMKNALAWLGLLIGLPGLDSLYQGQLDDVFLAFMYYEDAGRIQRAGPFAMREHVATNSAKAFNLDGVVTGLRALDKTKGYVSKRANIGDAGPYNIGKDWSLGHQLIFEVGDGYLFSDYATEMTWTDDRDGGGRWSVAIGDGSDEEDSVVQGWGRLGAIDSALKSLFTDVGADLDLIIF